MALLWTPFMSFDGYGGSEFMSMIMRLLNRIDACLHKPPSDLPLLFNFNPSRGQHIAIPQQVCTVVAHGTYPGNGLVCAAQRRPEMLSLVTA